MGLYAGIDAWRRGWVAVVIDERGRFSNAATADQFGALAETLCEVVAIDVDIPMSVGEVYPRRADTAARAFVGKRRSSVFLTPPRSALVAGTYAESRRTARERYGVGISAQSFALAGRILEVEEIAEHRGDIFEVHPEVTFRAMHGHELDYPKSSWNGMAHRIALLKEHGISLPADLGRAGEARPDDLVDAASAAWTARRRAHGVAGCMPGEPSDRDQSLIWY